MTTEPTPLVTVLPCDREAAARLDGDGPESMAWRMYIEGRCDAQYDVQLFARHRLAALEAAAKVAEGFDPRTAETDDEVLSASECAVDIATAIRALSNKGGNSDD